MARQPVVAGRAEQLLGSAVVATAPVAGGDISTAVKLRLSSGRSAFLKTLSPAPPQFFAREAAGLRWLAEAVPSGGVATAEVLANMNRVPEAIEEIETVAAAAPNDNELKMQLTLYYQVDNKPRKAIEIYTDVLAQDPNHAGVLRSRGDAYLAVGEHAAAVADFEAALKQMPDDPGLLNNLA